MRVILLTDAWQPQVNGVVRTLERVSEYMRSQGFAVEIVHPGIFRTIPCPTYPEIRLAVDAHRRLPGLVESFNPDAIHIATEGPLGWIARRYCRRSNRPFTSSFHTMFPDYVHARIRFPKAWSYAALRRFHAAASRTMVATASIERLLKERGFANLVRWSRGVDTDLFRPRDKSFLPDPRPIQLFVGRVAVEKNLEAFLSLDTPGTKYVIGEGPMLQDLRRRYPDVRFPGTKQGEELARYYAAADVFVFPSRTDTFGLVLLEALASGVPVAAYPVQGPNDVVGDAPVGCLNEDLGEAVRRALTVSPDLCRAFALRHSWLASHQQFVENLAPFRQLAVAS
jgi:glycosyltransferase involved in cell wall biosynthesis